MILSEETKQAIVEEYKAQEEAQYAGKTREERKELDQFYTEPPATIKMLEMLFTLDDDILDPCCGSGNLLAAAIIAGADPKRCYGVELDPEIVKVCRERLSKLGVPKENIITSDVIALINKKKTFGFKRLTIEDLFK